MEQIADIPRRVDTSHTSLPAALEPLCEILAEHGHDVWATERTLEGWKCGPEHSSEKKTHPCLVPFARMQQVDQRFDRTLAREMLKAILAMGCQIQLPDHQSLLSDECSSCRE